MCVCIRCVIRLWDWSGYKRDHAFRVEAFLSHLTAFFLDIQLNVLIASLERSLFGIYFLMFGFAYCHCNGQSLIIFLLLLYLQCKFLCRYACIIRYGQFYCFLFDMIKINEYHLTMKKKFH